jgi:outer membrane receptor protein involved in Fe transport
VKRPIALGLCLSVLGLATRATAGDSDLEGLLSEDIVVTASRTVESGSAAPATVSSISSQDLRRFGIRDLGEAVNFLSLGMFAEESPLDGQEFGARGVALTGAQNAHVLLLLDGHALNDQLGAIAGAAAYGGLPLELVDHIEVVLGPGSVLYGANAMLGVINVVTKRASAVSGTRVFGEADFSPSGTRGVDPDHHASYWSDSGRAGRAGVYGGYQFKLFGTPAEATFELDYAHRNAASFSYSYPFGATHATGTDVLSSDLPSAFARFSVGRLEVSLRAARLTRDTTTPANEWLYVVRDGPDGPPHTTGLDQWLNADVKYTTSLSSRVGLTGRLFGDIGETRQTTTTYDAILWCDVTMSDGCRHETPITARAAGAELQSSIRWTDDGSLSTLLGVLGQFRRIEGAVNYFDVLTDAASTYAHFQVHEVDAAAYAQQVWSPSAWLDLNVGARWDYEERFGDKLSPRAAAVLKPWGGAAWKVVYSEAYRGPSIRESFLSEPSGRLVAGDLRPESVRSIETTFEQRLGAHRLMTGLFRTSWTDLVGSRSYVDVNGGDPDSKLALAKASGALFPYVQSASQYQNVASIDNYGVEFAWGATGLDQRLAAGANVTLARAYRSGADSVLSTAPVLAGNAHVSYDFDPRYFTLGLASRLLGERYAESEYASVYPSPPKAPALLELRLTATGEVPHVSGLRYRFSAGYVTTASSAYVATLPPVYQNGPQAPQALRPVERYMTMLGLEYGF